MAGGQRAVELAPALPLFLNDLYIWCDRLVPLGPSRIFFRWLGDRLRKGALRNQSYFALFMMDNKKSSMPPPISTFPKNRNRNSETG